MKAWLGAVLVLTGFGLSGCGPGGPELADVEGKVTVDGKPVPNAQVTFIPSAPGGSPSYGKSDAEGHYSLMFTRDKSGAMLGTHEVRVEVRKMSKDDMAEARANGEEVAEGFVAIPKPAKDAPPLTREVKEGDNVIDLELGAGKT